MAKLVCNRCGTEAQSHWFWGPYDGSGHNTYKTEVVFTSDNRTRYISRPKVVVCGTFVEYNIKTEGDNK